MTTPQIIALRKKMMSHIKQQPQSNNWYAKQIGIPSYALKDFLLGNNSYSPSMLGKIVNYLRSEGKE